MHTRSLSSSRQQRSRLPSTWSDPSRRPAGSGRISFAHPTTQQQLLVWKERPKTVLVIKKLGKELNRQFFKVRMTHGLAARGGTWHVCWVAWQCSCVRCVRLALRSPGPCALVNLVGCVPWCAIPLDHASMRPCTCACTCACGNVYNRTPQHMLTCMRTCSLAQLQSRRVTAPMEPLLPCRRVAVRRWCGTLGRPRACR